MRTTKDGVGRENFGEKNHCTKHCIVKEAVITESKQNIPWKDNCVYFHSWKFFFAISVQNFFTDQNGNTVDKS